MKNIKHILTSAFLIAVIGNLTAQKLFVRYEQSQGSIQLKWISSQLVTQSGVHIYRSENGGAFQQITQNAFKPGDYAMSNPSEEEKQLAKSLTDPALDLSSNPLMMLVVLEKIVPNSELSQAIGIEFHDADVSSGKTYQYQVKNASTEGLIAESESINTSSDYLEPAPTEILFKQKNTSVSIGWKNESDRYYAVNIYRNQKGSNQEGVKVNEQPILYSGSEKEKGKVYQFIDSELEKEVTYEYSLVAVDYFGQDAGAAEALELGTKDIIPPHSPVGLKLEPDHATLSIGISWESEMTDDHAGFDIYASAEDTSHFRLIKTVSKDSLYTIVPIGAIGLHYLKIVAKDESGNVSPFKIGDAIIEDKIPPAIPTGLSLQVDSTRVRLTWNENTEPDLRGYLVYRRKSKDGGLMRLGADARSENSFEDAFPDRFVSDITYQVIAKDTNGNMSHISEPVSIEFKDQNAPTAPQIQRVNLTEKTVAIQWLAPVATDLDGFEVYRMNTVDSLWKKANFTEIGASSPEFIDRGVKPGNTYLYRMTAYDTASNVSAFSNLKTISVPAEKTALEIKNFKASVNKRNQQVRLEWEVSEPENVLAYVVFTSEGDNMIPISGKITETSFQQTPDPGQHTYTVKVFDKSGKKHISEPKTITVNPKK